MVYDSLNIRLSKSSVLQAHAVLRKSLKDAVKEGLIVSNPMDRIVSTPKSVRKEMEYLNQEEISLILSKDGE